MKKWIATVMVVCFLMVFFADPLVGQSDYPNKPITVIVPAKAGGASDLLARMLQRAFKENNLLDVPMVIVNVPGAGLSIGSRRVKDSQPDGYTFLLTHIAILSRQAAGLDDFGYRDFEPVAQTVGFSSVISVKDDGPYQTLPDLLKTAKEKPDTIIFGANLGALNHMAGLTLQASSPGSVFRFVQIGGGAPNFAALKGGHITVTHFGASLYNKFRSGGIKGLAILADERHPLLPDMPTARELGFDAIFQIANFWLAPKGTPQYAIDYFADALEKALETDSVKKSITNDFSTPSFLRGQAFKDKLKADYDKIRPIAQRATQK
jgi:tripartite-type tricarboxylate transporter receptor subunit TctC